MTFKGHCIYVSLTVDNIIIIITPCITC